MAYAAITSLMNTIQQSMESTGLVMQSFYEKLESLRDILETSLEVIGDDDLEVLKSLEAEIIELACGAEDMVESESRKTILAETAEERTNALWGLFFLLEQAVDCIDSTMKQWIAVQNLNNSYQYVTTQNLLLASTSERATKPENMVYAAITSLMRNILQAMQSNEVNLQLYYEKLESLRAVMEKSYIITDDLEALAGLRREITERAYMAGYMVKSESRKFCFAKNPISQRIAIWKLHFLLKRAIGRIESTVLNNEDLKAQNLTLPSTSVTVSALEADNKMVRLENEFEMIQDQLASNTCEREIKRHLAYAAITCLMNTIEQTMQVTGCKLQLFYDELEFLRAVLEKPWKITGDLEELTSLEAEITEIAYTTEDKVDSVSREALLAKFAILRRIAFRKLRSLLKQAVGHIVSKMNKWMEMQNRYTGNKDLKEQNLSLANVSHEHALGPENTMVGHENEFEMMQDQLARGASELEVVSIVGMGGIGKTTLANKIYTDPFITSRFDIRAKVTVSQEYCVRNVLLGLISSIFGRTTEYFEQDDGQLADQLQKLLKGKRYLIVIDDIWTTEAWDDIKLCFPDYTNGSRILLTTRNMEVAEYANSGKIYQMRLLNFNESWNLLHKKVFEKACFSPEFEKIGKQIALGCGGLPLAIGVISGLLSKMGKALDEWQSVAKNVSSVVSADVDSQCMRVLALSYHYLPHHLKPCFLYFAIFPKYNVRIPVRKLVELWAAEGFLKVEEMISIEEVAEQCLKDLMDRGLISIGYSRIDGKIMTCGMHDVTHELCLREARDSNFVNVIREVNDQNPRLPSMHFSSLSRGRISFQLNRPDLIFEKLLPRYPNNEIRSFICLGSYWFMPMLLHFKLVRVLDLASVSCYTFPSGILYLIYLRYLALTLSPGSNHYIGKELPSSMLDIPPSISNLRYLQTFKLKLFLNSKLPFILSLESLAILLLRVLCLDWNYLRYPEPKEKSLVLKNLQRLSGWNPWYCTGSHFRLFPNLKKLQIHGTREDFRSRKDLYDFRYLDQLEELEFYQYYPDKFACFLERITFPGAIPQDFLRFSRKPPVDDALPLLLLPTIDAFPLNLKKLAFRGTYLQCKDLNIVGKLPKLESLILERSAFTSEEWEVVDEGFPCLKLLQLKYSNIRYWRASCDHFPCLERLFLEGCWCLDSIPQDFADITTLALIDISHCEKTVGNSAKQIQQDMQDNYASSVEVHVS